MIAPRTVEPTRLASFIATRKFFPAKYIEQSRRELADVCQETGNELVDFPAGETETGGIETTADGEKYARWLRQQEGVGGVILAMPNFGDERGAVAGLRDAGVPIFIQTEPDKIGQMSPADRRDGFCGRCSITDNFYKYKIPFTTLSPHTLAMTDPRFKDQIQYFDRVCRVANGMRRMKVGAIGARTSAFKTVRIDEDALETPGMSMETWDLLDVYAEMVKLGDDDLMLNEKRDFLREYSQWPAGSENALESNARLGVVLDNIIESEGLDAISLRCWDELQKHKHLPYLDFSPCVLMSDYNNRGIPAACEVDVGNAIAMYGLRLASGNSAACLDWNNNFGDDPNKVILFHCGPVPQDMMAEKGVIDAHRIILNATGNMSYGCNQGRIKPGEMVFASSRTANGELDFYLGTGRFTEDVIEKDFFGCAGVARIPDLQKTLAHVCNEGHRHHVSATYGGRDAANAFHHALTNYRGFEVARPQLEEIKSF